MTSATIWANIKMDDRVQFEGILIWNITVIMLRIQYAGE